MDGAPGPSQILPTNLYTVLSAPVVTSTNTATLFTATANCMAGDTAISGGSQITSRTGGSTNNFDKVNLINSLPTMTGTGWQIQVRGESITFSALAVCFNNP
jgi:hypothetical protein